MHKCPYKHTGARRQDPICNKRYLKYRYIALKTPLHLALKQAIKATSNTGT